MATELSENIITAKNITSEVLLDTYTVGTIIDSICLKIDLLLGRTGGLIYGQGTTYTISYEIVRTVNGVSETFRMAKDSYVIGGTTTTSKLISKELVVNNGDVVKVYAVSSNANDTAVLAATWYYNMSSVRPSNQGIVDIAGGILVSTATKINAANINAIASKLPSGSIADQTYVIGINSQLVNIMGLDWTNQTLTAIKSAIDQKLNSSAYTTPPTTTEIKTSLEGEGTKLSLVKAKTDLIQTFPTNFSSLAIDSNGKVTVGTNSDKTGYSITQTFPSNFSSLSIDENGKITPVNADGVAYVDMMTKILSILCGKIVNTGDIYAYKKQDGETTAITLTLVDNTRIPS